MSFEFLAFRLRVALFMDEHEERAPTSLLWLEEKDAVKPVLLHFEVQPSKWAAVAPGASAHRCEHQSLVCYFYLVL